jgi:hypothetical protein
VPQALSAFAFIVERAIIPQEDGVTAAWRDTADTPHFSDFSNPDKYLELLKKIT